MDPYLGEIRAVAFSFAPRGWALCNGALLSISQNTALFALLGTQFGGDGRSNFALPNLQGNAALCFGQGTGLSNYTMGQSGGSQAVTLVTAQMPAHTHTLPMNTATSAGSGTPGPATVLGGAAEPRHGGVSFYVSPATQATSPANMLANSVQNAGSSQPHNNMQPYLVMNYVIALQGIFPSRP